jgi:hypothetical protein
MTTFEQKIKATLGEMQFQLISQTHQIEELTKKVEELKPVELDEE